MGAYKKFLDDWENSVNGSADGNGGSGQIGGATGVLQGQMDPRLSLLRENGPERALHRLIMGSYGADGRVFRGAEITQSRMGSLGIAAPMKQRY